MLNIVQDLPDNWESELEYQLLLNRTDRFRKRAYICSPCSDSSKKALYRNMRAARFYLHYISKLGFAAQAPHAYLPVLFSDGIPAERALALRVGLSVLEANDLMFVCGNRVSSGMQGEIEHAAKLGIPIEVFHPALYVDVRKIVTRIGADKCLVTQEPHHPMLALSAEEIFDIREVEADA